MRSGVSVDLKYGTRTGNVVGGGIRPCTPWPDHAVECLMLNCLCAVDTMKKK